MFTMGGLPESQAMSWGAETKKELGSYIFNLVSESFEDRRFGYIKVHEMRRHFMVDDWYPMIQFLDRYREDRGAMSITDMLENVRKALVDRGLPTYDHGNVVPAVFPGEESMQEENYSFDVKKVVIEQTDFFSSLGL